MSDSRLIDRLASLDAYPESAPLPEGWLDADLDAPQQGSSIVTALHELKRIEPETKRRDWRPIAAVAAVVVVIAAFLVGRDDGGDVAGPGPDPTTIVFDRDAAALATADEITGLLFIDDADALAAVLGDSLDTNPTLQTQSEGRYVNAEIVENQGCRNLDGTQTVCTVLRVDDFDRAFGLDPSPWQVTITYRDPESVDVLQVVSGRPDGFESPPVVSAFNEWIGSRVADAPECAGVEGEGVLVSPDECWPFIVGLATEFKDSESYDPFR